MNVYSHTHYTIAFYLCCERKNQFSVKLPIHIYIYNGLHMLILPLYVYTYVMSDIILSFFKIYLQYWVIYLQQDSAEQTERKAGVKRSGNDHRSEICGRCSCGSSQQISIGIQLSRQGPLFPPGSGPRHSHVWLPASFPWPSWLHSPRWRGKTQCWACHPIQRPQVRWGLGTYRMSWTISTSLNNLQKNDNTLPVT